MSTLWRWSKTRDQWEWETECDAERKKFTLRAARRRNPLGTVLRFTDGPPPTRRYRQRMVKG